jgi:hypothetical protein
MLGLNPKSDVNNYLTLKAAIRGMLMIDIFLYRREIAYPFAILSSTI